MNLFTEYLPEEIDYLLSLVDFKNDIDIPIFKNMSDREINILCRYIKKEKIPPKKFIDNYDLIWIEEGILVEVENKKVIKKYYKNSLIGIEKILGLKYHDKILITYTECELYFFDIKRKHNYYTSKFYKNLAHYLFEHLVN